MLPRLWQPRDYDRYRGTAPLTVTLNRLRYPNVVCKSVPVDAADNCDPDKLKPKSSPLIVRVVSGDSGEAK